MPIYLLKIGVSVLLEASQLLCLKVNFIISIRILVNELQITS